MKDQWGLKEGKKPQYLYQLKTNFKAFFTKVNRFSFIWAGRILGQPKIFNVVQGGLSFLSSLDLKIVRKKLP